MLTHTHTHTHTTHTHTHTTHTHPHTPTHTHTPHTHTRLLVSLIEKQAGVESEVLRNTQEIQQLYSEISGVQRKRADSQLTCSTMMAKLQVR